MAEVYWAPAGTEAPVPGADLTPWHHIGTLNGPPPTLPEDSPWLHVGTTTEDGLRLDHSDECDHEEVRAMQTEWRGRTVCSKVATLEASLMLARVFDVPIHLLGSYRTDPIRASVRFDYVIPTLRHAPWKQPGLTGRRYRIARRRHARALRAWIRAGRPTSKLSTYVPAADITLETP